MKGLIEKSQIKAKIKALKEVQREVELSTENPKGACFYIVLRKIFELEKKLEQAERL